MKFCPTHWEGLKQAIISRGLGDFIAKTPQEAITKIAATGARVEPTKENFEPLMMAHNMILINAIEVIEESGNDPKVLLFSEEDNPKYACPICFLNCIMEAHDSTCHDPNCTQKGKRFDEWIDQAANFVKTMSETLK